jgi:dipeptidyl-peptidase-4
MNSKSTLRTALLATALALQVPASAFELKELHAGAFAAKSVAPYRSMADGKHYTALSADGRSIVKYQYSTGAAVDTLLNLDRVTPDEGLNVSQLRLSDYELSRDEQRLLLMADPEYIYRRSYKADYYYYVIGRPKFKRLTEGKVQAATMAPDGRQVAFMRDNDLYLTKVMTATIELTERRVTDDGKFGSIINGVPDWVYEEEFSMNSALSWSSDSKMLAFLKFDESRVREYSLPLYRGAAPERPEYELYPGAYTYKYPVAGEVNSTVEVYTYEVYTKKTRRMNVAVPEEGYVPRVRFTADSTKLAVMTFDRHQADFRMYFVNPYSGESKLIIEDTNEQYVNPDNMDLITFYPDGFTFASEKSGYRHLYYYNMVGTLQRQITRGKWDVTDFYGYDPKSRTAYFQAAWLGEGADKPAPLTRGIYKVDGAGRMTPLFNNGRDGAGCRGTHSAVFSKGFIYMQHTYSDAETPTRVTLETVNGLKLVKVQEDNAELRSKVLNGGQGAVPMSKREFFEFTTERGDKLYGYLTKPYNFDPNKKYPVLMEQYSGPGSQEVLDRWQFGWEQYLNQQGYVVGCVDPRGTGARGAAWERQTYCSLGVRESEDQLSAGRYMSTLPYVDASRLAIWGWSFGGYNTLMTLCGGNDVYKVGVAVAPVTDWKFYDTVYSERYMRTPQENGEGYKASSVLERCRQLKGEVLVIHGSADDNVHPQNTYELTEQWVQEGIPFDMHLYTNRDHGIRGGNTRNHIYGQIYRYLQRNL